MSLTKRRSRSATPEVVASRKVFVWSSEDGSSAELDERLREWTARGWTVRKCEPRVVEGPAHAVLVVLRRTSPVERRTRQPRRRSSESPPTGTPARSSSTS